MRVLSGAKIAGFGGRIWALGRGALANFRQENTLS
jgi:hypothetical protein